MKNKQLVKKKNKRTKLTQKRMKKRNSKSILLRKTKKGGFWSWWKNKQKPAMDDSYRNAFIKDDSVNKDRGEIVQSYSKFPTISNARDIRQVYKNEELNEMESQAQNASRLANDANEEAIRKQTDDTDTDTYSYSDNLQEMPSLQKNPGIPVQNYEKSIPLNQSNKKSSWFGFGFGGKKSTYKKRRAIIGRRFSKKTT